MEVQLESVAESLGLTATAQFVPLSQGWPMKRAHRRRELGHWWDATVFHNGRPVSAVRFYHGYPFSRFTVLEDARRECELGINPDGSPLTPPTMADIFRVILFGANLAPSIALALAIGSGATGRLRDVLAWQNHPMADVNRDPLPWAADIVADLYAAADDPHGYSLPGLLRDAADHIEELEREWADRQDDVGSWEMYCRAVGRPSRRPNGGLN